jgi:DNA-binding transcriptional MerR regulator
MGAPDLIFELREAGYSIKADGRYLDISPADDLPADIVERLKQSKAEILAALKLEQQQEARRQKVLAMLAERPETMRAIHADMDSDPDNVILTIAIRHVATCEMLVPKAKYDAWQLLALVDRAEADHIH